MEVQPFTSKVAQEPRAASPQPFSSHSPGESLGTHPLTQQDEDPRAED